MKIPSLEAIIQKEEEGHSSTNIKLRFLVDLKSILNRNRLTPIDAVELYSLCPDNDLYRTIVNRYSVYFDISNFKEHITNSGNIVKIPIYYCPQLTSILISMIEELKEDDRRGNL